MEHPYVFNVQSMKSSIQVNIVWKNYVSESFTFLNGHGFSTIIQYNVNIFKERFYQMKAMYGCNIFLFRPNIFLSPYFY